MPEPRLTRLKTLILCVDRDDDLGVKGRAATPIVGRRRALDAAMALGLADPEDSDTNALLAAIKVYDEQLKESEGTGDQVEVAAVAGHPSLGVKGDRKLAKELDEVMALVRPDECILVSDGAEDEQILPLLQTRVKIAHVHRSVVKQAPRLEGFYYVITRLLDDEKQAKRFVLPFGIILLIWGAAYLFGVQNYAWGATLAIAGFWLVVQAMKWERVLGRFFHDLGEGMRSGKIALVANIAMAALLIVGAAQGYGAVAGKEYPGDQSDPKLLASLEFMQIFLPYFVSALLIRTAGSLFETWVRQGRSALRAWTVAFGLIAFGFLGGAVVELSVGYLKGEALVGLLTFDRVVQLGAGVAIAMGALVLNRYIRGFSRQGRPAR